MNPRQGMLECRGGGIRTDWHWCHECHTAACPLQQGAADLICCDQRPSRPGPGVPSQHSSTACCRWCEGVPLQAAV